MNYVDIGEGDPIVFLHGNPTSSYLWRNIIPYLAEHGRCLAPDLVGMGQSGKSPDGAYRFTDHARYLEAWFEKLELTRKVVLALHDRGSAFGLHRASRYPEQMQAIAYMEAIVQPRRWDDFPHGRDAMFQALRSDNGEQMVLDENFFVEVVLPKSIIRKLSEEEMDGYRAPFKEPEARLPQLIWPRNCRRRRAGGRRRDRSPLRRMVDEERAAETFHRSRARSPARRPRSRILPDLPEPTGGRGQGHPLVQEDSPAEIGLALRDFVRGVRDSLPSPRRAAGRHTVKEAAD